MAQQWRGVIEEYRERLPVDDGTPVVTLGEGGTPLVAAKHLSAETGCRVLLKVEGMNPTGSFKDRGMTMAISRAAQSGARAVTVTVRLLSVVRVCARVSVMCAAGRWRRWRR